LKPVHFDYVAATSPEEAVQALKEADGAGKIIAGGQSLVPLLNMRLARPARLVDINNLNRNEILTDEQGVTIGATVRQSVLEHHASLCTVAPLLAKCVPFIGHPQTRNRGTVVGSIVHADPSAELPLVAFVLDAEIQLFGPGGPRNVSIHDLYFGYMMTAVEPDEIALAVRFPVLHTESAVGTGFAEVARRHGDFAIASAACELILTEGNEIENLRFGLGGVHPTPLRLFDLEQQARRQVISDDFLREFVNRACAVLDPDEDLNATSVYRKHLAAVLGVRALKSAWLEAVQRREGTR